jgi:large subunit ribosomal protein L34
MPRIRKFGFRTRMESVGGRRVIKLRRLKGRVKLSISDEFRIGKNKKFSRRRR